MEPKQLAVENYGADVLAIVIEEIQKYMQTDITAKEKQYFQSKILTFQKIKHPTSDQIKKDFASHVNRTENLFNKVGYLNRLWPEISFLTS